MLADAIRRAKHDTPDAIRQAIQETKDFAGATGAITIDANRNADKPVVIVQIKGKKFTYFATVHGEAGDAAPAPSAAPAAAPSAAATAAPGKSEARDRCSSTRSRAPSSPASRRAR